MGPISKRYSHGKSRRRAVGEAAIPRDSRPPFKRIIIRDEPEQAPGRPVDAGGPHNIKRTPSLPAACARGATSVSAKSRTVGC